MDLISFRRYKTNGTTRLEDKSRDYHTLTFCFSGSVEYEINEKRVSLSEGDVLYVSPADKRIRYGSDKGACSLTVFSFREEDKSVLPLNYFRGFLNEDLAKALDLLEKSHKENNVEKNQIMLSYILTDIKGREGNLGENVTVRKIKSFIYQNAHKKITVDDISKHVFLSKIYCENIFKRTTGQTLVTFINNEKVRLAKEYLMTPETPLVKVSEQLGFTDYNYFSRLFKKVVGISPLQFREKQKNIKKV